MKARPSHMRIFALFLLVPLILLSSCDRDRLNERMNMVAHKTDRGMSNVMGKFTTTHRNYDYLQKTGGLVVKDPVVKEDETIFLPVYANIRGASNIIGNPGKQRSKASVKEVVFEVDEKDPSRLYIYVVTARKNDRAISPLVQGVNFGILKPGDYTVEYKNRNGSLVPISAFRVN